MKIPREYAEGIFLHNRIVSISMKFLNVIIWFMWPWLCSQSQILLLRKCLTSKESFKFGSNCYHSLCMLIWPLKLLVVWKKWCAKRFILQWWFANFPKKLSKKHSVVLWQVLKFLDKGRFDQFFAYYIFEQVRLSY